MFAWKFKIIRIGPVVFNFFASPPTGGGSAAAEDADVAWTRAANRQTDQYG